LILFIWFSSPIFSQINYKSLPDFPSFNLISSEGKTFRSTEVQKKNKPTVVVYFSPTCHHCQTQTSDITSNIKQFKEVQFLFVTPYPESETKFFLSEFAIERFSNIRFGYDPNYVMARFFEIQSWPGIFIYNIEGKLAKAFDTNIKPETLKETLNSL
jgi:cytochrome oxidase Cu insertion factor (SCO1/SenC/PrrC family)